MEGCEHAQKAKIFLCNYGNGNLSFVFFNHLHFFVSLQALPERQQNFGEQNKVAVDAMNRECVYG